MDDAALALVIPALRRKHPDVIPAIQVLTANPDTADAARTVLACLLQEFDDGEQARWTMRSMLKRVDKPNGGFYWALGQGAALIVQRLMLTGGADPAGGCYYTYPTPPEIANWKDEP